MVHIGSSTAGAWLARVAASRVKDSYRREQRRHHRETSVARTGPSPSTEQLVGRAELQRRVADAVLSLNEPYRTAVLQRYFDDRSPAEIADAMGLPLEPLPEPTLGGCEPTRRRPPTAEKTGAFVAMLPSRKPPGEDADLFPGPAPYVIRAMSLVPDAVRWLKDLSGAHYLSMEVGQMFDFANGRGPLSRAQTELIAGRVSAVNECFY